MKKERWKKTDGVVGFEKKERKRRNERRLIKMKEGWKFGQENCKRRKRLEKGEGKKGGGAKENFVWTSHKWTVDILTQVNVPERTATVPGYRN